MNAVIALLFIFSSATHAQSQPPNTLKLNLVAVLGLSFYNESLALINQDDLLLQDVRPENYYRFQLITKFNYMPITEKWALGAHAGAGYESFKTEDGNDERVSARLFKFGLHTQYEFLTYVG